MEGEEERREGSVGKSLGERHWLAPLLLGGDLSGRSHQQRGMGVGRMCIQPSYVKLSYHNN